ncbi:MAG: putative Zn finger-like uncharacterized protein [Oceanospirillaceae bacterium]|jgi:predicted Zn finger-like uncharacterized protein
MTAPYSTHCPSCHSGQLVNPSKFTLAAGKVRCSKCGCMFDAHKHRKTTRLAPSADNNRLTLSMKQRKDLQQSTQPTAREVTSNGTFLNKLIGGVCVLLLLLSILQLAYFNRDNWINIAWLQPLYTQVINPLRPSSTTNEAAENFTQLSLVIQPAVAIKNALSINFSFQNTSKKTQKLPSVVLIFSDLRGKLVTQRVFNPLQYLNTGDKHVTQLPSQGVVNGELSILQTAQRGLNYQVLLTNDKSPFTAPD